MNLSRHIYNTSKYYASVNSTAMGIFLGLYDIDKMKIVATTEQEAKKYIKDVAEAVKKLNRLKEPTE